MLDKIATLYCGFVVKQAPERQTWPKEKKETTFSNTAISSHY